MNKRGVELALNAVIIAVIILIVAAVIIAIFVTKIGDVQESATSCTQRGGTCELDCPDGKISIGQLGCAQGDSCCVKFGEQKPGE